MATIIEAPGIKLDTAGKAIASAEISNAIPIKEKASETETALSVNGIGLQASQLRPEMKIIVGRNYQPAVRELIVGRLAQQRYRGLELGNTVQILDTEWKVVGVFAGGSTLFESSVLGDNETLMSAYGRNSFSDVVAQLASPDSLKTLKDSLTANPSLQVEVVSESEYFAKSSKWLIDLLSKIAYLIGGIMAIGALFAALNTMYAAVSTRTAEIATLRAIGFGAAPVVTSIIFEAVLLTLLGAALGIGGAWLMFNGNVLNVAGITLMQSITPALALRGLLLALLIGLLGGILPAIRAARLPVAEALRAV